MKPLHSNSTKAAFSLVEMMVAMAVFSILMLLVTQMLNSAVTMSSQQHKRMDSEDQARLVFSRMAVDFDKMIKRGDVDNIFAANVGNDAFYYYSEAPAAYDSTADSSYMNGASKTAYNATSGDYLLKNSLALVGYRINSNFQLERLGKALNYDGIGSGPFPVFLTVPPATPSNPTATPVPQSTMAGAWATTLGAGPNYTSGVDTDYHVLGDDVFRMEIFFQLSNGTYSQTHTSQDLSDVSSIIVTLAILDQTSRGLIPSGSLKSILNTAAQQLPDPAASDFSSVPPMLPEQKWSSIVNSAASFSASTGMPTSAASQIRVYQQYFYLSSLR